MNYYNEKDPYAAAWLRNLVLEGLIAPGEVDERSIEDVTYNDIRKFTQCHFFAGIGCWSYALRLAGWPDDRPVWTGSCPCQPFSAAGKAGGFADERHLWPAWFHLIEIARPQVVFGEQVASKDGLAWLDLVQTDLEGAGYAIGANDLSAAGVGAPHIRQRLYFVADAGSERRQQDARSASGDEATDGRARRHGSEPGSDYLSVGDGADSVVADADGRHASTERKQRSGQHGQQSADSGTDRLMGIADSAGSQSGRQAGAALGHGSAAESAGGAGFLGIADSVQSQLAARQRSRSGEAQSGRARDQLAGSSPTGFLGDDHDAGLEGRGNAGGGRGNQRTPWTPSDFVWCRDEKWRPVEPGTFPLAHGVANRVGRLRAYGNAIVAPLAAEFIEAYLDVT